MKVRVVVVMRITLVVTVLEVVVEVMMFVLFEIIVLHLIWGHGDV